jgi:hypothetical protein
MVFSSIGDTTRVSPLQNAVRSGLLATDPLLRSTVSGANILAWSPFAAVSPADSWLCGAAPDKCSCLPAREEYMAGNVCIGRNFISVQLDGVSGKQALPAVNK